MKLSRNARKLVALTLSAALVLGGTAVNGSSASAAKKATLKLSRKSAKLAVGKKLTLKVKKKNVKSAKITWKSSKKAVASVSKKGVVKAKKAGKAKISAVIKYKAKGSKKTKKKTLKCTVTVTKKAVAASKAPVVTKKPEVSKAPVVPTPTPGGGDGNAPTPTPGGGDENAPTPTPGGGDENAPTPTPGTEGPTPTPGTEEPTPAPAPAVTLALTSYDSANNKPGTVTLTVDGEKTTITSYTVTFKTKQLSQATDVTVTNNEKFYWNDVEQTDIKVLDNDATDFNTITVDSLSKLGGWDANLGYGRIDNVDKTWSISDIVLTVNEKYAFDYDEKTLTSMAGKKTNSDETDNCQKIDLHNQWGEAVTLTGKKIENPDTPEEPSKPTPEAIKLDITAYDADNNKPGKVTFTVNGKETEMTSFTVTFKTKQLSQAADVTVTNNEKFYWNDVEQTDIKVLDNDATDFNTITVDSLSKLGGWDANLGYGRIDNVDKTWSISDIVLTVNEKYAFDYDEKTLTSMAGKKTNSDETDNCQKIDLHSQWGEAVTLTGKEISQ